MFHMWDVEGRRQPRSKGGCATCRQRRVRCNEQKPRCSHCERLNLECTWRATTRRPNRRTPQSSPPAATSQPSSAVQETPPRANEISVDETLGYLSVLWNDYSPLGFSQTTSLPYDNMVMNDNLMGSAMEGSGWVSGLEESLVNSTKPIATSLSSRNSLVRIDNNLYPGTIDMPANPGFTMYDRDGFSEIITTTADLTSPPELNSLTGYLSQLAMPPILSLVETESRWNSMRKRFVAMASSSAMVRDAVKTFSFLSMDQNRMNSSEYVTKYDSASAELSQAAEKAHSAEMVECVLATYFFLSYSDIIADRISLALSNLRNAFGFVQNLDKSKLTLTARRLISWIRLLDARAVSAGGEGLFLSDEDESLYGTSISHASPDHDFLNDDCPDGDIDDVLFEVLYQPGFLFFQKVQSFGGHIAKIDPWHRSRGTVEDETEVMVIAKKIFDDLLDLYNQRPPLMDHALAGNLTQKYLSAELAFTTTRSFRAFMSNYYSTFIYLHRVAYKQYPRTATVDRAIQKLKELAKLMSEEPDGILPVNMLWPLLMLGCEEDDQGERDWIVGQIRKTECVASNAKITADVLEEVQKRQDVTKQRVDARLVMLDIFKYSFAVV